MLPAKRIYGANSPIVRNRLIDSLLAQIPRHIPVSTFSLPDSAHSTLPRLIWNLQHNDGWAVMVVSCELHDMYLDEDSFDGRVAWANRFRSLLNSYENLSVFAFTAKAPQDMLNVGLECRCCDSTYMYRYRGDLPFSDFSLSTIPLNGVYREDTQSRITPNIHYFATLLYVLKKADGKTPDELFSSYEGDLFSYLQYIVEELHALAGSPMRIGKEVRQWVDDRLNGIVVSPALRELLTGEGGALEGKPFWEKRLISCKQFRAVVPPEERRTLLKNLVRR